MNESELVTTDDGFSPLTSDGQVVAVMQRQVDGMRAAGYARTEVLDSDVRPELLVGPLPGDVLAPKI